MILRVLSILLAFSLPVLVSPAQANARESEDFLLTENFDSENTDPRIAMSATTSDAFKDGKNDEGSKVETVSLTPENKALKISGNKKWIGGKIVFKKALRVPADTMIMASVKSSGKCGARGLLLLVTDDQKKTRRAHCHTCSTSSIDNQKGEWQKMIYYLGDYCPGQKEILVRKLIFVQRVAMGFEHEENNEHAMYVDNIVIASGKSADPIRKEAEKIGGIRYYSGSQSFMLPGNSDMSVWASPSTAKVFKKQALPQQKGSEIKLTALRNEGESCQLVVTGKKDIEKVSLELSPLKNKNGQAIPLKNMRWHPVVYKRIRHRYFSTAMDSLWPEMLSWNRSIDIKKGVNQPFWITVNVPENAVPGVYNGKIDVKINGKSVSKIPLTLTVHNAILPRTPTFRTLMQVWGAPPPWHPGRKNVKEDKEKMQRILTEYKLSDSIGFNRASRETKKFLSEHGLNVYKLPFCGGHRGGNSRQTSKMGGALPMTEEYKEAFIEFLDKNKKFCKKYGLEDKALLQLWDEPFGDPEVYEIIKWLGRICKEQWPELKTYASVHYSDDFAGLVDIFAETYSSPEIRRKAAEKNATFWRVANSAADVDLPAIDMRSKFGLDSIRQNIGGAKAWGIAVWKMGDPWTEVDRYNADAFLFYPGSTPFSESPEVVRSITLEILRDSVEDYEYASILKNYAENGKNEKLKEEAGRIYKLFTESITPVHGLRKDFSDVDQLHKAREEAIKCIENIQKNEGS